MTIKAFLTMLLLFLLLPSAHAQETYYVVGDANPGAEILEAYRALPGATASGQVIEVRVFTCETCKADIYIPNTNGVQLFKGERQLSTSDAIDIAKNHYADVLVGDDGQRVQAVYYWIPEVEGEL